MTQATKKALPKTRRSGGKPDDPEQYGRFLEAAQKAGAAQTEEEADRAFKKVVRRLKPKSHR